MRRVGQCFQGGVTSGGRGAEPLLGLAQLLLDLLRCGLALLLLTRAEVVHPRHELAPALVGFEPGIEALGCALPRERGPITVGVVARGLRVDQVAAIASGTRRGLRSASAAGWRMSSASRFGNPAECSSQGS